MARADVPQRAQHDLSQSGIVFFELGEQLGDLDSLEVVLGAAEITGDDGVAPREGVALDVLF
ncbi:MAG: hypothetical protein MK138_18235 [Planctomycetes bacterium]|nr:hypothetical protein [Planctomycetota bacterium]MCH2586698.1 hypothetical protein [Planctomycetota bacterium]